MKIRFTNPSTILLVAAVGVLAASPALAGTILDTDGDGVVDIADNCSTLPQGGAGQPGFCDTDADGYGNACDGDFNNDQAVTPTDFSPIFTTSFGGIFNPDTDMNCDGAVTPADFSPYFLSQFGAGAPGPSGLGCAGTVPCP